ncbi:hypothetical protein COU59_01655 [Candidatus Pacearchaeota archaeon CG10_big_fil_rev_8_21_14_0_10_34_12]|nr:MAG: hypothetical protein COU59_01655 [Candidatus Pacearchaeota archaeon CG10_big_fil_rev_8_21_14_0_10_34_12]
MNVEPIVMDIETSGLDRVNCGIWQIGAIDLNNIDEVFMEEGRIDDEDIIDKEALKVIGKTEEELRDKGKQSQKDLVQNFFNWMKKRDMRNLLCQNPQFDLAFIEIKAGKYGIKKTIQHRAFDLHSIAQIIYKKIEGNFMIRKGKDTDGKESNMNLSNTLGFCGIPDNRIILGVDRKVHGGNPHNALEDCKLTGECYYRLLHGKNLFPEFSRHDVPNYLEVKGK